MVLLFPEYNGAKAGWRDYESKIDSVQEIFKDEDARILKKLGNSMKLRLTGKAWDLVKDEPAKTFGGVDGVQVVLETLRKEG